MIPFELSISEPDETTHDDHRIVNLKTLDDAFKVPGLTMQVNDAQLMPGGRKSSTHHHNLRFHPYKGGSSHPITTNNHDEVSQLIHVTQGKCTDHDTDLLLRSAIRLKRLRRKEKRHVR